MNDILNDIDFDAIDDNELYMLYEEDDENAKNIIFLKYKFIIDILVKKNIKAINMLHIDLQEVYSEAYIAFTDALNNYDKNNNSSLSTFISLCVDRRVSQLMIKYNRNKYKVLNETYSLDYEYDEDGDRLTLVDFLKDDKHEPLKFLAEKEQYKDLKKRIVDILTPKEYEVFMLLSRNFNIKEIGSIVGFDYKKTDNAIQRIKIKVRNILDEIEKKYNS